MDQRAFPFSRTVKIYQHYLEDRRASWDLHTALEKDSIIPFHSPSDAVSQYLNNRLNPLFACSAFKNSIPALDQDTRVDMWGQHTQAIACLEY